MRLLLVAGCALAAAGVTTPATECTLDDGTTKVPVGWKGTGKGGNWCSTCFCVPDPAGVADPTIKCRTDCAPDEADLRCCNPDTQGDSPACCGLTGEWVTAPATEGGDVKCKHVSRPVTDPMGAPFTEACAKPCTVDGVDVHVGWVGKQSGANWCNKCRCAASGLKCRTRTCRPPKCCPPHGHGYGQWKCCGATGKWVMGVGGVFTCAGHTSTTATELPFGEECGTCDIPGVSDTVQVGWFGKIRCNNCYCKNTSPPKLVCRKKACDCDFKDYGRDASGKKHRYVSVGFVGFYREGDADTCTTQTCTSEGVVTPANGVAIGAGCPLCKFEVHGADFHGTTHATVAVGFKATYVVPNTFDAKCVERTCVASVADPVGATTMPAASVECPPAAPVVTCDFSGLGQDSNGETHGIVAVGFTRFYTTGIRARAAQVLGALCESVECTAEGLARTTTDAGNCGRPPC